MDAEKPPLAWPRSVEFACVFLLGGAFALIGERVYQSRSWSARPLDLDTPLRPLDLNAAGPADLRQLPGVGEKLAGRILDHRRDHGPFRGVEELARVEGVGPATLAQVRPWLAVAAEPDRLSRKPPAEPAAARGKKEPPAAPVDVNAATADDLQRLPGIGPVLAGRIVAARPFAAADDLRRVSGIGPKTLAKIRPHVTAGPAYHPASPTPAPAPQTAAAAP